MVKIAKIQQAIKALDGGQFQEIMDEYLYKKYKFTNITRLGLQAGTSKTTKGTPDSFVENDNGKYTLIMYGTVEDKPFAKLKKDIEDTYNIDKTHISEDKIEKVICCYTSNNINIEQRENLKNIIKDKNIILIGIDDLAFDIANNFQGIAKTHLNIAIDSGQISDIDEFIERYDKSSLNAPLNIGFIERSEKQEILELLKQEQAIIIMGKPGVGKTRLSLEICKQYIKENNNIKCLCIRNNGNNIYEDLNDYIEQEQEYLIFVDDANEMKQLTTFMDFIKLKEDKNKIKVILTVRDYALQNIALKLNEYIIPKLYKINNMEDKQLIQVLENEYNIKNKKFQEQILKIANGNPRIAVLAAKGIVQNKIKNLQNVIDIFRSYYLPVIQEKNLDINDIKVLFVISLLGPFNIKEDNEIDIAISKLEIEKEQFITIVNKLNKIEMVDLYNNTAVKISDQNFGNYIEYKFLIEDKVMLVSNLIECLYPKCILKMINAFNMINSIFADKETEQYLIEEVKKVWDKEPYNSDSKFLTYFYNVNRIKAIGIMKKEIEKESVKLIDLSDFDFKSKMNNEGIDNKKIEILSSFKYGELNEEAIELLIEYFIKRPDLVMDFYFGFTLNMGIDENSIENNFKYEKKIIDKFINKIHKSNEKKINLSILLIKIIENFLAFEHHITKASHKKFTYSFIRLELIGNEEVYKFRNKMFSILIELYQNDRMKKIINSFLFNYNIYPSKTEEAKIFKNDVLYLSDNLFLHWLNPDFIQCEILKKFKCKCEYKKINIPNCLRLYTKNKDYAIFDKLEFEREGGKDWKKAEEERKDRVIKLIKTYDIKDYSNLFRICYLFEQQQNLNIWHINTSIMYIFDYLLTNKKEKFLTIFQEYLNHNSPFLSYPDFIIEKMINIFGQKDVLTILESNTSEKIHCYLKSYYSNITSISEEDINHIFNILQEQKNNESVYVIDIKDLIKYEEIKKETIETYSKILLNEYKKKTYVITLFFDKIYNIEEHEAEEIISSYNDISILEDLYILGSYGFMDNKGIFAMSILKKDINFIIKIINAMKDFQRHSSELDNIFENIWKIDDYEEYINIAYNEASKNRLSYFEYEKIFISQEKNSKDINDRKEKWIEKYINNNYRDIQKMKCIFDVVNSVYGNKRKKYILQFIYLNKKIEDFKKIPLFSSFSSWTGSEIPIIDNKIRFLIELNGSINGLEYIEHKEYIDVEIEYYKQYKRNREIREYIEEYLF